MVDYTLDCKGQQCPTPIIQISKQLAGMRPGQLLRVEAIDPAFRADITTWTRMREQELETLDADGPIAVAVLIKR